MNLELMAFLTDPNRLWAIDEAVLLGYKDAAERHDGTVLEARAPGSYSQDVGQVAVLTIAGPISYKPSIFSELFGGSAVTTIQAQLRKALGDSAIKAIVMNFDTPGGTVTGLTELAAEIRAAGQIKPVVGHAESMAASAGFWLMASTQETSASRSAVVGSIGIIAAHADISQQLANEGVKVTVVSAGKYKAEGSPFAPLSTEALAEMQGRVDAMYGMFVKDVAAGRGVSEATVRSDYGQGRTMFAAEAKAAGMIDRIGTLDDTLRRMSGGKASKGLRAETEITEPADAEFPVVAAALDGTWDDDDRAKRLRLA
jgi:signal peptide peptidase SppA